MDNRPEDDKPPVFSFTSSLKNDRGMKLFTKYWEPVGQTRALVFLAHGYAEHCLLYDHLAKTLAFNNFYVFSHDHVGHGQSEGRRAVIDTFQTYVDDVYKHVDSVKQKHPGFDCFICGHSMGGAISILSAIRKPSYFKGVVLIGPAVATNPELTTPFRIAVARILRRIAPNFPVAALDLSLVSSDPKQVKLMKEDKLRFHGCCKVGFGACLLDVCKEIQEKIPSMNFPFIICQGDEDKLCTPEGAVFMYQNAASIDKTIKLYPKAYHSLLVEPNGTAQTVESDILYWLLARS